jgi:ribonuclease-3
MSQKDYAAFADKVFGRQFNDPALLLLAFTHRSYLNEHRHSADEHNERLEFLGDAVLELIVTEHLYASYEEPEGILTNWRSALVRTESLAETGLKLGLEEFLRLSRGERNGSERARHQILANTIEALIGALYLDQGYEAACEFVTAHVLSKLEGILENDSWRDPKSLLQEVAQSEESMTPSYRVLGEDGPDHDKVFTIGVFIGDELRGKGEGPSKQAAQQKAAERALNSYHR